MRRHRFVGAALLIVLSSSASAAPFCVVSGGGQQCGFSDYNYCWQVARSLGGACVANATQPAPTPAPVAPVQPTWQTGLPQPLPPNAGLAFWRGMDDARAARQQERAAAANQELARAQQAYVEEQTRALRLENDRRERERIASGAPGVAPDKRLLEQWQLAAEPRMGLYPDFQSVVFAPDVEITMPMIEWMAGSMYAADIAYYLGTHKAEASRIAREDPHAQALSLKSIETIFIERD